MISQHVIDGIVLAHGHAGGTGVVVARQAAACHFPFGVVAHKGGGDSANGAFDPVAVTVIDEGGRECDSDAGQLMLDYRNHCRPLRDITCIIRFLLLDC